MTSHRFVQLDVFTEEAFAGNPLAVFPDGEGIAGDQMLRIAREMNLSETVFVLTPEAAKEQSPQALRRLRIFTPTQELPFAGHPVVGTWNLLAREGVVPKPESGSGWTRIHQQIGIGTLPVDIEFKDGEPKQVVMTQSKPQIGDVLEHRRRAVAVGRPEVHQVPLDGFDRRAVVLGKLSHARLVRPPPPLGADHL